MAVRTNLTVGANHPKQQLMNCTLSLRQMIVGVLAVSVGLMRGCQFVFSLIA